MNFIVKKSNNNTNTSNNPTNTTQNKDLDVDMYKVNIEKLKQEDLKD